jgi:hypothetical protein
MQLGLTRDVVVLLVLSSPSGRKYIQAGLIPLGIALRISTHRVLTMRTPWRSACPRLHGYYVTAGRLEMETREA